MDYSFVANAARIALYDDMLTTPRIVEVAPARTMDFIGELSSQVYNLSREMGGGIPFSAIRQVTENFIHADFREVVVSIFDAGNTIRFTDQGPGIADKERAQLPGFSSATEDMKHYIDGVGSGLPIVREYLDVKHGTLTLDDNLNGGSVVTLSLTPNTAPVDQGQQIPAPVQATAISIPPDLVTASLSHRARQILTLFKNDETLGVQEIATATGIPLSSTHTELRKLEESGLVDKLGKKRILSDLGRSIAGSL